jgi:hypothetical protein
VCRQGGLLLDEDGEPLQNDVEDAAGFAGGHHVAVQRVEDLRLPAQGRGE